MAGSWNGRNRRTAKLRSRYNWYKGKQEVDPPGEEPRGPNSTSRLESSQEQEGSPTEQASNPSRMEDCVEDESASEQNASRMMETEDPRGQEREASRKAGRSTKVARKGKLRGPNRQTQTLGGIKKQEIALKRRAKRKVNRERGKAGIPAKKKSKEDKVMLEPPVSVMFVENTRDGILARMLQVEEKRLGGMTSYRVRVAESAGMALSRMLPSTNPWGPGDCGRHDCQLCNQQDETRQDCRKRNVLYENRCQVCMVDVKTDGKLNQEDGKGVYIGETSRSMYERSKEHQKDRDDKSEDSHQVKHWALDHPDLQSPPRFKFKILSTFTDPLTRQIAESVRIERSGVEILNSKSEYSRCRVPRLTIDMEGWKANHLPASRVKRLEENAKEADNKEMEVMETLEDSSRRMEMKRKSEEVSKRKSKRMKFERLEGWGESEVEQKCSQMDDRGQAEQQCGHRDEDEQQCSQRD